MLFRRIIDENVETVEFRDRLVDALLATEDGAHIAGNGETPSAFLLYKTLGFLCILMLVEIDDRHIGTLSGESHGNGSTDPAIAAGNQGHLPMQFSAPGSR